MRAASENQINYAWKSTLQIFTFSIPSISTLTIQTDERFRSCFANADSLAPRKLADGARHSPPSAHRRFSHHENGGLSPRSSPRPPSRVLGGGGHSPIGSQASSKDVVRIFVPAAQNGDAGGMPPPPPPRQLILKTPLGSSGDPNRIKIKVPDPLEDKTPLVEHGRLVTPTNGSPH